MRYALLGLMAFSALIVCQRPGWAQRLRVAPAALQFGAVARPLPGSLQSSYNAASGPACRNPDLWIGYDPCETCGSHCQHCDSCQPKKRYTGMLTSFHSALGAFKKKKGCCSEPACTSAPSCGCEQPASCGCEAEPACGCEAPSCCDAATCCGATDKKCKWGLLVWLKKKMSGKKTSCCDTGCCDAPCESCTAEPSCGCQGEPAPACAGGSCSDLEDEPTATAPAPLQPVPSYQPSYQPHSHQPAPMVKPETEMEMIPVEPAATPEPADEAAPPNPFKDDPSAPPAAPAPAVPAPADAAPPAADPEAPAVPFDGPALDASTGAKDVKAVGHNQLLNKFFLELRGGNQPTMAAPAPAKETAEPRTLSPEQQEAAPQETSKLYWQPRNKPADAGQKPSATAKEPRLLPGTLIRFGESR